jgi:hypothetical protein
VGMAFGDVFVKELKMSPGGWGDVPVGDYKLSHLHEHPNLKIIGAPKVIFNQSDGEDVCIPSPWHRYCFQLDSSKRHSKLTRSEMKS